MTDANRPPSSSRVGARVRVKPAHQQEVEALFSDAGVSPIYNEMRPDGNVSYWFGKDQQRQLHSTGVVKRIPLEYWADYAVIGSPTQH